MKKESRRTNAYGNHSKDRREEDRKVYVALRNPVSRLGC